MDTFSCRIKGMKKMWIAYTKDNFSLLQNSYKNTLSSILSYTYLHIHVRTLWFTILSWLLPPTSNPWPSLQASPEVSLKPMGQNGGMRKYFKNHGSYSVLDIDMGFYWSISEIPLSDQGLSWELGMYVDCREKDTHTMESFFSSGINSWVYRLSPDVNHDWLSEALFLKMEACELVLGM